MTIARLRLAAILALAVGVGTGVVAQEQEGYPPHRSVPRSTNP